VIGKPINVFIDGNVYISGQMKESFAKLNCPIVDTSDLIPEEVARQVVGFILKTHFTPSELVVEVKKLVG